MSEEERVVPGFKVARRFRGKIVGIAVWNGQLVVATAGGVYAGKQIKAMRKLRLEVLEPNEEAGESL